MPYDFTVKFYWNGYENFTHHVTDHLPKDELEAVGVAATSIKKWFQDQNLTFPKVIKSVTFYEGRAYKWTNLSISTNDDKL